MSLNEAVGPATPNTPQMSTIKRRRRRPHTPPRPVALLLLLAFAVGCGDRAEEGAAPEVGTPPSLRSESPTGERIRLTEVQAEELNVQTVRVTRSAVRFSFALPGEVLPAPENYALVSAPISGRVTAVHAHEGERVRRGQVLLELESLEFANLAADYLQAIADEAYHRTQVERITTLVERKISPRSALEKALADLGRSQMSVSATYARLQAVGVRDEVLESWSIAGRERPLLQVYAPISGAIDRHEIDLGQSVTAYQEMLSIIDASHVLIRGFVSPEDAPYVSPGDTVRIGLRSREPLIEARVSTINPALDASNRSVVVNVLTPTRDGWPLPGQNVRLEILSGSPRPAVSLPMSAVQYEGQQAAVFVRIDPVTFEKRFVEIDRLDDETVVIASGLQEGEDVAVTQVFSLKALSRFELYGEE